jgi:hypothetical protein
MKVAAVYARRHEPQWLIDDLRTNLAPFAGTILELDDRGRPADQAWAHEGQLRARQRQMALESGADWVLIIDPDERIEDRAAAALHPQMRKLRGQRVILLLRLRELFAPDRYRVDGKWGMYRRGRLYPLHEGQIMSTKPIHAPPCPVKDHRRVPVDVNLYHLKMIEPQNRPARAAAYSGAEQQAGVAARRWGQMTRSRGMVLQGIPAGRRFSPPYTRPYVIGAPE